ARRRCAHHSRSRGNRADERRAVRVRHAAFSKTTARVARRVGASGVVLKPRRTRSARRLFLGLTTTTPRERGFKKQRRVVVSWWLKQSDSFPFVLFVSFVVSNRRVELLEHF